MAGEATFIATETDYVAANRLWHARSGRSRLYLGLGIAAAGLAILNLAAQLAAGQSLGGAIADSAAIIIFGVIIVGIRFATPALLPRQVRKMMTQHQAMGETMHCIWDDDGLKFSGSNGTANLSWARLHRWMDDAESFVFLQSDRLMFIVPKRVLSDRQRDDLHDIVVASGLRRR